MHESETRLVEGKPLDALRAELERMDATLAVVGTRGHSRAVGIALGSVTTHLLRESPCSVLVALHQASGPGRARSSSASTARSPRPRRSAAATELAERQGAALRFVVATREPFDVDVHAARELAPGLGRQTRSAPAHVLSEEADLIVVGSRGLRGMRALGSVSERVAHEARCSVLVVRGREPLACRR